MSSSCPSLATTLLLLCCSMYTQLLGVYRAATCLVVLVGMVSLMSDQAHLLAIILFATNVLFVCYSIYQLLCESNAAHPTSANDIAVSTT